MKFHTLAIHNFLTIGDGVVKLADRGLNVIQGENPQDSSATSNGAGKSSVVDALCWCLYGVTAREVKGDDVINEAAGKDCYVRLSMSDGSTFYQVERYRKHKTHKNQLHISTWPEGGAAVRIDRGTEAESQKLLEQILGCSYEVFVGAVYAGQEQMADLPSATDRELKRLIEEAAGMQRLERAYLIARERMNTVKDTWGKLEASTLMMENTRGILEGRLKQDQEAEAAFEAGRAGRVADAMKKLEDARGEVLAADAARLPLMAKSAAVSAKLKEVRQKLADHSKVVGAIAAMATKANDADRKINRTGLALASKQILDIRKKIDEAPTHMGKPCVECGKPHTAEELDEYLAIQNKALVAAQENAARVKAEVERQIADAQALRKAAEDAAAAAPSVDDLLEQKDKLDKFERALTDATNRYNRAFSACSAAEGHLAVVSAEPNPHTASRESSVKELADLDDAIKVAREKLAGLAHEVEIAESVVKTFGPAGVRAQILDTVTPYLNARTADYLSVLSDGNLTATWQTLTKDSKGELKEKFSIAVTNATGGSSFKSISGGEKRKVRLACMLAMQDLVSSRASKPIECWIGDEIDDALDPAGLERLMTILERKARERGTVIVISHNDLTDWCDLVTTVTKIKPKVSAIEGELCI